MKPIAFAGLAGVVCIAGVVLAAMMGVDTGAAAGGLFLAWLTHATSFFFLARAFASGRAIMAPWVGGMLARLVGVGAVWYLSSADLIVRESAQAFVFGLIVLVFVEATWLALVVSRHRSAEG